MRRQPYFETHQYPPAYPKDGHAPVGPIIQWKWRDDARLAAGLNMLVGGWLMLLPSIAGFSRHDVTWNPIVFGAVVVVFAATRITDVGHKTVLPVINAGIGVWVAVSAFLLAASIEAQASLFFSGATVLLLGLMSATATSQRTPE